MTTRIRETVPVDESLAIIQLWNKASLASDDIEAIKIKVKALQTGQKPAGQVKTVVSSTTASSPSTPSTDPILVTVEAAMIARELEETWKNAYASYYKEFTWVAGVMTAIDVYDTASKGVHLFNRTFGYTGSNITSIVTTRYSDSKTLTKTLTYDSNGIANITVVAS